MTNEESFNVLIEKIESFRSALEAKAAATAKLADDQAATLTRIADAFERIAVAAELHSQTMVRMAAGMEHSIEQQFHSVR